MKKITITFQLVSIYRLSILIACLAYTSCTSTTVVDEAENNQQTPITFGSKLTRAIISQDPTTGKPKGMSSFAVWGGVDQLNNLFSATAVQPDGSYQGTRYWVPGKIHNFYAIHPAVLPQTPTPPSTTTPVAQASMSCTDNGIITISHFDASLHRGTDAAVDLMSASTTNLSYTVGSQPLPVKLTFRHELAWISFMIATQQEIVIDEIKLTNIEYKGNLTLIPMILSNNQVFYKSSWSNLSRSCPETGSPFVQKNLSITTGQTYDLLGGSLLMPPQKLQGSIFHMSWTYKHDPTEKRVVHVPMEQTGALEWLPGKHYVYSAIVPATPGKVTFDVSIKPWNKKDIHIDL